MSIIESFLFYLIPMYFPEDKTEYIPAFIQIVLIIIGAILTVVLFKKISKKQEEKAKEIEERLKHEMDKKHS